MLRVKPSDWTSWLQDLGIAAPKRDALQVLRDAGLVQKVYALPKHPEHPDAKSFGLYTGPARAGPRGSRAARCSVRLAPTSPAHTVRTASGPPRRAAVLCGGTTRPPHHCPRSRSAAGGVCEALGW